jgi:1-acyl-sn-glycerol-3-phosphate acyltransferase
MGNIFWNIFNIVKRFRFTSFFLLVVCIAFLGYGIANIKLEEDISKVLMSSKEVESVNKLMDNIDFSNKIVLVVSQRDTSSAPQYDSLISTANQFVERLHQADSLIGNISFGVDDEKVNRAYDVFYRNLPLFLEEEDYQTIANRIEKESINKTIEGDFKALMTPAGVGMRSYILKDPLHFTPLVLEKLKRLQLGDSYKLYQNQIFSGDGYHLFFFMESAFGSSDTKNNILLVKNIQQAKDKVDNTICTVDYYGAPIVSVCNATQIKRDIFLTVGMAVVLLILLISFLYRSVRIFILVFIPVLFGISVSLCFLYWTFGSISAITLGVGSILMGITINYTIHAYVNFRSTQSIKTLFFSISEPLVVSSLTTSIAFLCLYVVDSPTMKQLGIFASLSIFSAVLFVLIVTPHFLKTKSLIQKSKSLAYLERIVAIDFDKLKHVKWIVLLLTLISIYTSTKVVFNPDLDALNYQTPYLKKTEKKLQTISSEAFRSVFFVVSGQSADEALSKFETYSGTIDSLKHAGIIRSISTVSTVLKSKKEQQARLNRWNTFWTDARKKDCLERVNAAGLTNRFKPEAFSDFENLITKDYTLLAESDQDFMVKSFLNSLLKEKDGKVYLLNTLKVDQKDKKALYSSIAKDENAVLWDKQYFSVQLFNTLKSDFNRLVWISLTAVFLIILFFYGRFELTIIAMLPIVVSWFWTLGLMGIVGIEFNIFSIIISTFMFGLGDDYAEFILNAQIQNRKNGTNELVSAKLSILLSALTTFVGFGVLIFAKHPALRSIAALSIIGIGSILILSYILIPWCYRFLYLNNGKERTAPVTISNLFTSVFAFTQFLTGCATLTALIPVLIILPIRMRTKKYIFHRLVQLCHKFIVYSIFGIRKKFINREKFNLSSPKIIVSNHQSHLDLSLLMMLHPKIIVLTNNWVWNNPFYGFIVKFLDFYPVSNGMDEAIEPLKKLVADGYSILIFPEGRRTRDGKIGRFHNGAVFLSEKLGLDILPVLIHGANHCMDRHEFFIRNGQVTLKFFDTIPKEDYIGAETYILRSKLLLQFFRTEFEKFSLETETPDYYSHKLIQSYIYKGPVLEWYLRIKIRLEHNYNFFNDIIPREGVICDIGCGYGFLSAMLKLVSPNREIIALDYDEEKILLARNAFLHVDGLKFEVADISNVELPKSDVFILNDVLHYLPENLQTLCIENCMKQLNEGGKIIIRDADTDLEKRTKGTKLTEFFSTRLLHFNKTGYAGLFFFSGKKIEEIAHENNFVTERIDNTKFTSNMIYILSRKEKL